MVERVIDIVLSKTATAIFSFASGARSGGSIPSPATILASLLRSV